MLNRHVYKERFHRLLKQFPVVCILGARQCGKTTFVQSALPKWRYLDLEKPSDLARIKADPEDALQKLQQHFILDEAQQAPELFPLLRGFVDRKRKQKGQIVILGSASPTLITQVSETLAGRVGFLDMAPFHWSEIQGKIKNASLENRWFRGGFPDVYQQASDETRFNWFEAYTRTFIERDLTNLGIQVSSSQMRKLWTMLAHVNGGIWNASPLASSLGVSYHTVNRYVDILEQTFLIRKLPPYFFNIKKRLVKSPKIYFTDSGMLHYFLGIHKLPDLHNHPARGASWEMFIVEQVIKIFDFATYSFRPFFWRTATGIEVDLLMVGNSQIIPFEIKLHSSPQRDDVDNLALCMRDLKLDKGYVIYPGEEDYSLGNGITALAATKLLDDPKNAARLQKTE